MFEYCASLESVNIPNTVTRISGSAFSSCYSLKSVTIPEGVETIGLGAFYDCTELKSVIIPNSVTKISEQGFGWYTTIYTNNEYVKQYCKDNNIPVKPLNNNESYLFKPFKLHIK